MPNDAIVPQFLHAFWGITVFRWDINIRESAILELVRAGGSGLKRQGSLNVLARPQVTMILSIILATVVVSEWVSARTRAAVTWGCCIQAGLRQCNVSHNFVAFVVPASRRASIFGVTARRPLAGASRDAYPEGPPE